MKPWRAVRRPTHQIPAGVGCPARTWCACSAIVQHNAIRVFFEKGAAYKNAMERARENELRSVGFCILSAGIFRGGCPLKVVIETGLMTIAKNTYPGLETVVFCGFTPQEQAELDGFAARVA